MSERVPFINRAEELTLVENLVRQWGTRKIVLIQGDSGIGKTRLLQEVRKRFAGAKQPHPVLIPEIIDFHRAQIHFLEGLGPPFAEAMNHEAFESYWQSLDDWRKMAQAPVTSERLEEERQSVVHSFTECFNAISSERRIVLLVDTVDTVTEQDVTNMDLVSCLENVLLLIAGRKAQKLDKAFPLEPGGDVRSMPLPPLGPEDSKQYLLRKQEILQVGLAENVIDRILLLAAGKLVILDLAVEWLAHEPPMNWLVEDSLDKLRRLPAHELELRYRDLEYHLVRFIARRRNSLDQLFLVLAKVDSLDIDDIAGLLRLPTEEAEALWSKARQFCIVKGKRIALHEETRRMVEEYAWPEIDPTGDRLRRDSQRAAAHFQKKVATLQSELGKIKQKQRVAQEEGLAGQELEARWQREAVEKGLWMSAILELRSTIQVDLSTTVERFVQLFDFATDNYAFSARQALIDEMEPHLGRLSSEQKFKFAIRKAKPLREQGDYLGEKVALLELLRVEELLPHQQVEALIQLGNTEIRMGDFMAGIARFGEAVQIAKRYGLTNQLAQAKNALGWGYRLRGQVDQAIGYYRDALRIALDTNDQVIQAEVLNNLGYAYALRGNKSVALQLCHQALEIEEQLGRELHKGRVLGTIATVLTEFGEFREALSCRQEAIKIFERAEDLEGLGGNYWSRGATHWLMGDLEAAQADLEKARVIGITYQGHIVLHYLAHVYKEREGIERALELFERSYTGSQSLPDPHYELRNLGGLAEIAGLKGQFSRWSEFESKLTRYNEEWSMVQFTLPEGLLWRYIGDLAVGDGQLNRAIGFYKQGFPLIAEAGTHEPYTIFTQLCEVECLLQEQTTCLRKLGQALMQFWLDEELDREHPEVLSILARWKHQEQLEDAQ